MNKDYFREYLKIKKKYIDLKNIKGGYRLNYIDEYWKDNFEKTIIKNYYICLNTLMAMNTSNYIRISPELFFKMGFFSHYSTSLNKTVFVSNLICNAGYYFEIIHKSYIITRNSVPIQEQKYYYGIKLLLKKNNYCNPNNQYISWDIIKNNILSPKLFNSFYDDLEYSKKKKLKKKEKELEEYENELEKREQKLKKREKKSKKKKSKKKKSKKKKVKRKN